MNASTTAMSAVASSTDKPFAKPKPYRRFLTSALHSRFVHAALISLVLALDDAIILGPKNDFFWSWFPLGPAGIRALLFFVTSLAIIFLQIATLRVGKTTSASPFAQFRSSLFSLDAAYTVVVYVLSALWYTHVYVFGSSSSNLGWIEYGDLKTPNKLNERPIYIRTFAIFLALAHAVRHIYCEHSTLPIPVAPAPSSQTKDQRTHPVEDIVTHFKLQASSLLLWNLIITGCVTISGPFIYAALLRQTMWRIHLALAKPFYNLPRSNARATGYPPLVGIIPKTFVFGMLLSLTWEASTFLFLAYLAKSPIKKDRPLSDASRDPNGTLLNGLKAKRDIVKTFAFWELIIIAQSQQERRKAIFNDIDRPTGPIWASMLEEALKVLEAIDERIEEWKPAKSAEPGKREKIDSLPKLLPPPNRIDVVSKVPYDPRTASARIAGFVGEEAEKLGSSARPFRLPLDKALKAVEDRTMSPATPLEQSIRAVTSSPVGWFFTSTNAAKINKKVLGSPYGNAALIVDAIESITKMLVASMQDDAFGKAIKGVPPAVKQFTKTITLIEVLIEASPPSDGDTTEVSIIYARLKAALTELLSAFQQFLFDTGLSVGELNDAKKASGQKGIEAAKEQQTPAPIEEEKPKRVVKVPREKEQNETWREWGSQRLPKGEARQPLFSQHTLTRKSSRGANGANGNTIPRRREMEQVR